MIILIVPGSISVSTRACQDIIRAKAGFDSPPGSTPERCVVFIEIRGLLFATCLGHKPKAMEPSMLQAPSSLSQYTVVVL